MQRLARVVKTSALLLCGAVATAGPPSGPFFTEGQDPAPSGKTWAPVESMSDEFDGDAVDLDKWQIDPLKNGWGWIGRAPGLFRAENVSVVDGRLCVTVSPLPEPVTKQGKEFIYQGAIVRSIKPGRVGYYYETRMKANATAMSSTFWLMTNSPGPKRQELDIQECIGHVSDKAAKWAQGWDQIFHSNLIRTEKGVPGKTQFQEFVTLPEKNHERFNVYAAWWKSPEEVRYYLNGEYTYSLHPDVAWDMPAYIQMAIETYDWNPVPEGGGLITTGDWEQRTTQYDWVRVWRLRD